MQYLADTLDTAYQNKKERTLDGWHDALYEMESGKSTVPDKHYEKIRTILIEMITIYTRMNQNYTPEYAFNLHQLHDFTYGLHDALNALKKIQMGVKLDTDVYDYYKNEERLNNTIKSQRIAYKVLWFHIYFDQWQTTHNSRK